MNGLTQAYVIGTALGVLLVTAFAVISWLWEKLEERGR